MRCAQSKQHTNCHPLFVIEMAINSSRTHMLYKYNRNGTFVTKQSRSLPIRVLGAACSVACKWIKLSALKFTFLY